MERVTFSDAVVSLLLQANGETDIVDEQGKIVGIFYPAKNSINRQLPRTSEIENQLPNAESSNE